MVRLQSPTGGVVSVDDVKAERFIFLGYRLAGEDEYSASNEAQVDPEPTPEPEPEPEAQPDPPKRRPGRPRKVQPED